MTQISSVIEKKIARTLWHLRLERFAQAFWPLWVIAAMAGAVWLTGLYPLAGLSETEFLWSSGAVLALGFALCWSSYKAPTRREALLKLDRSLERPLISVLDDQQVTGLGDHYSETLWEVHRQRIARAAGAAEVPGADLRLSSRDGWGLRYWAALVLLSGGALWVAGGKERLTDWLVGVAGNGSTGGPVLEIWASPPAFTGLPPVYLSEKAGQIELPRGSEISVRLTVARGTPRLVGADQPFTEEAEHVFAAEFPLERDMHLSVQHFGRTLGAWQITGLADEAPTITFTKEPFPTDKQFLGFEYVAADDYGVARVWAEIGLDEEALGKEPDTSEAYRLELADGLFSEDDESSVVAEDLTEHIWAGLPVVMHLYAEDGAGQQGHSEAQHFHLPGKLFTEPMAKALIEQRRNMGWREKNAPRAADMLEAAIAYPETYFNRKKGIYLAIRAAQTRLNMAVETDRVSEVRPDVVDLLWEAAISLEEGDLEDAKARLEAIQKELMDALERGAPESEIAELMDKLRKAIDDYITALAKQTLRNPQGLAQQQQQGGAMSQNQLQELLDQLEESARGGMRDQAQRMLSMLNQLLDNMQVTQGSGQGEGQGSAAMQKLQELMRRQQELADETFEEMRRRQNGENGENGQEGQQGQSGQQGQQHGQQPGSGQPGQESQQGQPGPDGEQGQRGQSGPLSGHGTRPEAPRSLGQRQESIRDDLSGLLDSLGDGADSGDNEERAGSRADHAERRYEDPHSALDRADSAMGDALQGLGNEELEAALNEQIEALDALREGARGLEAENRNEGEGGEEQASEGGQGEGRAASRVDPFGRLGRSFGPDDGLGVDVPTERARNRAQEIQRELQERSSDRERPPAELDYLERLQKRF